MRILFLAGGALAVFLVGETYAAETSAYDLQQPKFVQLQYDYTYYQDDEASDSPSDQPVIAAEDEVTCGDAFCPSDPCGGSCRNACEPCKLPQPCFLKSRGFEIGGWLSAGLYTNARGAPDNGPLGFNDLTGFNMHQLWLYAERTADTGGYGTDWGFRVDYVFGVDGPDTQATGDGGWDFGWNSSRDYGSAIPQLYFEFAVNDLKVKLGHFYTIIGYEVVQAPDNFFFSHAYTHFYGEPFSHTGFLAEYPVNDRVTAYGGWTMGWDSGFEGLTDASTFLGGLSFTLSNRTSLAWALTAGDFGRGAGDIYMNSIVLRHRVTDRLTYVLQHDLGDNSNLGAGDNEWYGINQYLLYDINPCWAAGLRFEWFRDDDGTRVVAGNAGDYYALTAGLNWRPNANVTFRPEIRYDNFDGIVGGALPFNQGRDDEQFSGGFDVIVTY